MKLKLVSTLCIGLCSFAAIASQPVPSSHPPFVIGPGEVKNEPIKSALEAYPLFSLVQRNCDLQDLTINKEINAPVYGHCKWYQTRPGNSKIHEDIGMQITLHIPNDVDYVVGHCTFKPVLPPLGRMRDSVISVKGSKSAGVDVIKGGVSSNGSPITPSSEPVEWNKDPDHHVSVSEPSVNDNGNQRINFYFKNNNSFLDEQGLSQANVIFYLKNQTTTDEFMKLSPTDQEAIEWAMNNFNEGNTIDCSFEKAASKPYIPW